ncbi:MAG: PASTA domain-containing protein [Nostocoides sp.]
MTSKAQDQIIGREVDGRYRVLRRLAEGGMAVVYLAVDLRLDREIALKMLYPHLAADPQFVGRFRREAQSAARLSHPHLVAVFDQFQDDGDQFLAMEYVPGTTMADVVRREGPMTARRAAGIILPVLDALGYAHGEGFLHRDVKPENVLIRRDGVVKVADFGLARTITSQTSTSATGVVLGTAAYLSPEQVEHGVADARSDVYAAGLLLFEALTGTKAFRGDNPIHVAYQHVHGGVPAMTERVDAVPAELAHLLTRATSRDPDDRPADGRAMATLMRQALRKSDPAELDHRPVLLAAADDSTSLTMPMPPVASTTGPATTAANDLHPWLTSNEPLEAAPSQTAPLQTEPARTAPLRTDGGHPVGVGSPDSPEPPDQPRNRRRAAWLAVLLAALLAAGTGWFFLAGPGAPTAVPAVAGAPLHDALASLDKAYLSGTASEVYSEDVPAGNVVSSDPPAGASLRRGSTIDLQVSKGPERYAVPRLAGSSQAVATSALTKTHLALGAVSGAWSETVKSGVVISTDPKAGVALKPGSKVALVVSKGRQPIQIPDYTGKPAAEAKAALTTLGFTVEDSRSANSDSVPKGAVISQDPRSGTGYRGGTITLVISKGPVLVTIPDVRRLQEGQAKAQLQALGLVVTTDYPYGNFFGTVRETNPAHGTQVPKGSTVVMTVF